MYVDIINIVNTHQHPSITLPELELGRGSTAVKKNGMTLFVYIFFHLLHLRQHRLVCKKYIVGLREVSISCEFQRWCIHQLTFYPRFHFLSHDFDCQCVLSNGQVMAGSLVDESDRYKCMTLVFSAFVNT